MVSRHFVANLQVPKVGELFTRDILIGEGTYGKVYKSTKMNDDDPSRDPNEPKELFALKIMKVMAADLNNGLSMSACREIAILRELKHENVIMVQEVFLNHVTRELCFRFAYAEYDLLAIITHNRDLTKQREKKHETFVVPESMITSIMWQLLQGIHYMHSNWILHRDMKPANVLVMGKDSKDMGLVVIADLGMARAFNSPLKPLTEVDPVVVTFWYRSPELLLGAKHYTKSVDLWAIGCIMAELTNSKPLFHAGKAEKPKDPYHKEQLKTIFEHIGFPRATESETSHQPLAWQDLKSLPQYNRMLADFPEANQQHLLNPGLSKQNFKIALTHRSKSWTTTDNKFHLLEKLLRLDPKQRETAKKALSSKYFLGNDYDKRNCFYNISDSVFTYPKRKPVEPKEDKQKNPQKRRSEQQHTMRHSSDNSNNNNNTTTNNNSSNNYNNNNNNNNNNHNSSSSGSNNNNNSNGKLARLA